MKIGISILGNNEIRQLCGEDYQQEIVVQRDIDTIIKRIALTRKYGRQSSYAKNQTMSGVIKFV